MIRVTNTENLTGVTISGDFYDLDQLVRALHEITVTDMDEELDKYSRLFINISIRVLSVCYEIRHAAQGGREILTKENAIDDWHMEANGIVVPKQNVYYSCNVLYPEMILVMMTLNDLVKLRMDKLAKSRYKFDAPFDKAVVWDRTIATIRMFQSAFQDAIADAMTKASFARWQNLVNNRVLDVRNITHPFVDSWNIRYLKMDKETRAKKLGTITKRFIEHHHDPDEQEYRRAIDRYITEHGCSEADVYFEGLDYPEEIEW
jgi:hypothetical protein